MTVHIVENGVVARTIVATIEEAQAAFPGAVCVDGSVGAIGWAWDGVTLSAPLKPPQDPVVPESITRWQALTILNQSGLLDAVEAYVGSLPDRQAQIDFSAASVWRRDWSWLGEAATELGWTSEQVDQMFIAAAAL